MSQAKFIFLVAACIIGPSIISASLHYGCVDQSWCTEPNSYCTVSGFCECYPNATEVNIGDFTYYCIYAPTQISGPCSEDTHCPSPAFCNKEVYLNWSCACPPETHLPSLNMTICLTYADTIGADCHIDSDICSRISNSECFSGYCMCKTGHIPNADHSSCLKMAVHLSDECVEDSQCHALLGSDTICAENRCYCKYGHAFNADRTQCHPIVEKVGEPCEIDEQCVFTLGHARCNAQGLCRCTPGYLPDENGTECILSDQNRNQFNF